MARSGSRVLAVSLLLLAALYAAPAFVSAPAPRTEATEAPSMGLAVAAGMLPLIAATPAMASGDYMMPPSWPFLLVFLVLASALLVVGNFIFPGERPGEKAPASTK
mmetsp:Transcript_77141/g.139211  ORF Transcript_77141/g.139211 Transcript_77141/m.139211 type:complete len:106 (+) Transcript_77141:168-485(+)